MRTTGREAFPRAGSLGNSESRLSFFVYIDALCISSPCFLGKILMLGQIALINPEPSISCRVDSNVAPNAGNGSPSLLEDYQSQT